MEKKTVLVTGSNGGIGLEICKKFKNEGWFVVGTSYSKSLNSEYIDLYIQSDLTLNNSPKEIIQQINKNVGRLDCVINNAALQICKPIWELKSEEWDKTFNCNLKSIFLLVKESFNLLKNNKGNIINIGSVHATNTSDQIAAYACTKAAIVGFTRNLAIELGNHGIRVNCVSPGAVDTKMLRAGLLRGHAGKGSSDDLVNNLGKSHILGKVGNPEDIATFIYDVSKNKFLTGANLIIDGGATIKLSTE